MYEKLERYKKEESMKTIDEDLGYFYSIHLSVCMNH